MHGRLLLALTVIILPSAAYAYLDPGTGNIVVNLVIGTLAALLYSLKGVFYRIVGRGKMPGPGAAQRQVAAIFSEGKQYWGTFKPIVNSLIEKQVHFSYYTLDVRDPALLIESEYMTARFLGHGYLGNLRFMRLEACILLSTTPNIGTRGFPLKRPKQVKKLVHVFHSINDISAYRKGSLDNYDAVVMAGEFQRTSIRAIEKVRNLVKKELVPLGLPYFDDLVSQKETGEGAGTAKTVLVGSSWGSKGCLRSYGSSFIRDIAEAGYRVIVRPHPQSMITEQSFLSKLKTELAGFENIVWDESVSPSEAMNEADILVSDTSSLRFDFAFIYEKPVVTLNIQASEMPGYERDDLPEIWTDTSSHEVGYVLERSEISRLVPTIERALTGFDSSRIRAIRDKTIVNYGRAGDAIAEYLREGGRETGAATC